MMRAPFLTRLYRDERGFLQALIPFLPMIGEGVKGLFDFVGSRGQSRSAQYAAEAQTRAAMRAAELEAQSARDALAFQRQVESARRNEWAQAQAMNYGLWQQDTAWDRQKYLNETNYQRGLTADRIDRTAPYRVMGLGALGQLMVKPGAPAPPFSQGSIASLLAGRRDPSIAYMEPGAGIGAMPVDESTSAAIAKAREGLAPTSASLDAILKAIPGSKRARHANNTLDSDDKIVLPNGQIVDLIGDVGGPGARWLL